MKVYCNGFMCCKNAFFSSIIWEIESIFVKRPEQLLFAKPMTSECSTRSAQLLISGEGTLNHFELFELCYCTRYSLLREDTRNLEYRTKGIHLKDKNCHVRTLFVFYCNTSSSIYHWCFPQDDGVSDLFKCRYRKNGESVQNLQFV